jgi:ubiquitin-conjugating enzyme E2 O
MRHFHERERAILEECCEYDSGMIVGSSVRDGRTYARDECFARFKKSLDAQTELLEKELSANRIRTLELMLAVPSTDEIMSSN